MSRPWRSSSRYPGSGLPSQNPMSTGRIETSADLGEMAPTPTRTPGLKDRIRSLAEEYEEQRRWMRSLDGRYSRDRLQALSGELNDALLEGRDLDWSLTQLARAALTSPGSIGQRVKRAQAKRDAIEGD